MRVWAIGFVIQVACVACLQPTHKGKTLKSQDPRQTAADLWALAEANTAKLGDKKEEVPQNASPKATAAVGAAPAVTEVNVKESEAPVAAVEIPTEVDGVPIPEVVQMSEHDMLRKATDEARKIIYTKFRKVINGEAEEETTESTRSQTIKDAIAASESGVTEERSSELTPDTIDDAQTWARKYVESLDAMASDVIANDTIAPSERQQAIENQVKNTLAKVESSIKEDMDRIMAEERKVHAAVHKEQVAADTEAAMKEKKEEEDAKKEAERVAREQAEKTKLEISKKTWELVQPEVSALERQVDQLLSGWSSNDDAKNQVIQKWKDGAFAKENGDVVESEEDEEVEGIAKDQMEAEVAEKLEKEAEESATALEVQTEDAQDSVKAAEQDMDAAEADASNISTALLSTAAEIEDAEKAQEVADKAAADLEAKAAELQEQIDAAKSAEADAKAKAAEYAKQSVVVQTQSQAADAQAAVEAADKSEGEAVAHSDNLAQEAADVQETAEKAEQAEMEALEEASRLEKEISEASV